jgi:hypothetical protein
MADLSLGVVLTKPFTIDIHTRLLEQSSCEAADQVWLAER